MTYTAPAPEPGTGSPGPAPIRVELTNWGLVGSETYWGPPPGQVSTRKVVRFVAGGFTYSPPPPGLGVSSWSPSRDHAQIYEMSWSQPVEPKTLFTLGELGRRLREKAEAGAVSTTDNDLAALDGAARRLLEVVAALHDAGREAGLLHPEVVLLVPGTAGRQIVLPDLGFVWVDPTDDSFTPNWLGSRNNALARLWLPDTPIQRQNATRSPRLGPDGRVAPAADLRTVARLLASVLNPDGHAPRGPKPAQVWTTLAKAESGQFDSAEAFKEALGPTRTPLSHHFLAPDPTSEGDPPGNPPHSWPIAAGAIVIALLGGVLFLATRHDTKDGSGPQNPPVGPMGPDPNSSVAPPPVSDSAWETLVAQFRRETNPLSRPTALSLLADYVVKQQGDGTKPERGERLRRAYLGLWKETFADPPHLGAGRFSEESSFYRALRIQLRRIHECPAPANSALPREEQSCLDQLPLF